MISWKKIHKSDFFKKVNQIIVKDLDLQFEYDVLEKKVIDKRVGKKFKYENVGEDWSAVWIVAGTVGVVGRLEEGKWV